MTTTAFEGFTDEELGHLIDMLGKHHGAYSGMTTVFGGALVEAHRRAHNAKGTADLKRYATQVQAYNDKIRWMGY